MLPLLTNAVGEPAVKKGLVGGPALGQRQIALALERFERLEQHLLARPPANGQKGTQRGDRLRAHGLVHLQVGIVPPVAVRSEEHTSELQSLMRISYAVFCLKKNKQHFHQQKHTAT